MKLTLKNIGKIGTASVEINGITVIAGENNTGKSTVGRALFAVFNSFCNVQKQIENERVDSVENLLDRMYMNAASSFRSSTDLRKSTSDTFSTSLMRKTVSATIFSSKDSIFPSSYCESKSIILFCISGSSICLYSSI